MAFAHDTAEAASIHAPSCAIIGPSGSGKTNLALHLAGLSEKPVSVPIDLARGGCPVGAAFIPTDPYLIFSCIKSTLRGELELSLQFVGHPRETAAAKIERIAVDLELVYLLDRDPFTLSGGEAVRAALAVATIKNPLRLVTDEIYVGLASDSMPLVRRYIAELGRRGCELFEIFNSQPYWISEYDRVFHVGERALDKSPDDPAGIGEIPIEGTRTDRADDTPVLQVEGLNFHYDGPGGFTLGPIDLDLRRGEVLAILGPNGAGKTTWLKCLAQLLDAKFARAQLSGIPVRAPVPTKAQNKTWSQHILYVFQNPDDQIYCATVHAELLETAKWLNVEDRFERCKLVSCLLDLTSYWGYTPSNIPRPARRLLTCGSAFVAAAPVILLDEPTAGLDADQKQALRRAIGAYRRDGGAIVMVSHDGNFISELDCRHVELRNGNLVPNHAT